MADITLGLLAAQRQAAERCDALEGGDAYVARHRRIEAAYREQFERARDVRRRVFQSRYGDQAAATQAAQEQTYRRELSERLQVDAAFCRVFGTELDTRLSRGWGYLQGKVDQGFKTTRPVQD